MNIIHKKKLFLIFIIGTLVSCEKSSNIELIPIKNGNNYGYIDQQGKIIINPQFSQAYVFHENVALVRSSGSEARYGYIDTDGKYISTGYSQATCYSDGLAWVVRPNEAPTAIDKDGNIKITMTDASSVSNFSEGLAAFSTVQDDGNTLWGFINKENKTVISPQFKYVSIFNDGLCPVLSQDNKWGYVDRTGKLTITPQFDFAHWFIDGIARISNDNKWGIIDKDGKFKVNPQFEYISSDDKKLLVKMSGKWGWTDLDGKIIINPQFEYAYPFYRNDLAPVKSGGKWGYINQDGKYEINPQFDHAYTFNNNTAVVISGGKVGLIDHNGKYIINPQFDDISYDYHTRLIEKRTDKWTVTSEKKMSPSETVSKYLNSLKSGDINKAKQYGTKNTQDMLDALNSMNMLPVIDKVENIQCSENSYSAQCTFCCQKDGKNSINLIQENGKWIIDEKKEAAPMESSDSYEVEQAPTKGYWDK